MSTPDEVLSRRRVLVTRVFVAATLTVMAGLMLGTAARSSSTFDEPYNLAAGHAALHGDLRLVDRGFGPLSRMLCAAPLLLLGDVDAPAFGPRVPPAEARLESDWRAGGQFVFMNRRSPHDLLRWGRLPALMIGLALALAVGAAARARHGDAAGALALGLVAFEPLVLGHAPLIGTDVPGAAFGFMAIEAARHAERGRRWQLAAGIALGAALGTKLSLGLAVPAVVLLTPGNVRVRAARLALIAAASLLTLVVVYRLRLDEAVRGLASMGGFGNALGGRGGYLLGRSYPEGTGLYYPIALALKSSLALSTLLVARLLVDLCGALRRRTTLADVADLVLPAMFLGSLVLFARWNTGARHMLPAYPFLLLYAAGLPARAAAVFGERTPGAVRVGRTCVVALLAWHVAETIATFPRYIAFTSVVWGRHLDRPLLLDADLDWGQELPAVAETLRARGLRGAYLAVAWIGDPAAYGLSYQRLAGGGVVPEGDHVFGPDEPRVIVISANLLFRDGYAWLRERAPLAVVGRAMYVFDVTRDADAFVRLAENLLEHGQRERAAGCLARAIALGARPPAALVRTLGVGVDGR